MDINGHAINDVKHRLITEGDRGSEADGFEFGIVGHLPPLEREMQWPRVGGGALRNWELRRGGGQTSYGLILRIIQLLDTRSCHLRYHTNG